MILIRAPSGSVLVAMRTRVHRRVCNETGLGRTRARRRARERSGSRASGFGTWPPGGGPGTAEITWEWFGR